MLYHVTMTHTEDNCPAYHPEIGPAVMQVFGKIEEIASDLNVKLHCFNWCPPNHEAYVLLEADTLNDASRFAFAVPLPQTMKVVPVEPLEETVAMAKVVMAQRES